MEKRHLPLLAITELSSLIEKKEVSPVEVVEAHLERIDRLNARLHAYLTICREAALRAAREAEQAIVRGQYHGPLHGMPFAVKDQLSTRGLRTTAGSPIFAERVIDEDATVISTPAAGRRHPPGEAEHDGVWHHRFLAPV